MYTTDIKKWHAPSHLNNPQIIIRKNHLHHQTFKFKSWHKQMNTINLSLVQNCCRRIESTHFNHLSKQSCSRECDKTVPANGGKEQTIIVANLCSFSLFHCVNLSAAARFTLILNIISVIFSSLPMCRLTYWNITKTALNATV